MGRAAEMQDIQFTLALESLEKATAGSVDIENSFRALSRMRYSPKQAEAIAGLAQTKIPVWIEATDADSVVKTLIKPLTILRDRAETSQSEDRKFTYEQTRDTILAQIVIGEPKAYPDVLVKHLREGVFGPYDTTLAGILRTLSTTYQDTQQLSDLPEQDCELVAMVTQDLINTGNKNLLREIKPVIPAKLLLSQEKITQKFPDVYQLAQELGVGNWWATAEIVKTLRRGQLSVEDLKTRIHQGRLGDPIEVLGGTIIHLYSKNNDDEITDQDLDPIQIDMTAEELWTELLGINKTDKRLKLIRETVAEQDWYWTIKEEKSITGIAIETLRALHIPADELVERYGDKIIQSLLINYQNGEHPDAVERIVAKRDHPGLKQKLSRLLEEVDYSFFKADEVPDDFIILALDPIF